MLQGRRIHRRLAKRQEQIESHNRIAFISDGTFFNLGSAFLDANTILPTFISTLTGSSLLIGLVSTIRSLGYFLPQVVVAGHIGRLKRKKPFMMQAGLAMRVAALGMAISSLFAEKSPGFALCMFYVFLVILSFTDGFGGLPWMDLVARTISPGKRGSLFGTMQATGGAAAFLAGFLIQILLSQGSIYPLNYFIVFFLGFLFLTGSLISMSFIIEPGDSPVQQEVSISEYLRGLPGAFRENHLFRQVILVRTLAGSLYLALPFFTVHAQQALGFSQSVSGLFVSSQMIGTVLGGPLWGNLGDNHGAFWVVRIVTLVSACTGVIAIISRLTNAVGMIGLTYLLYFSLYIMLGAVLSGIWIGFSSYVLDISREESRSTLLGLLNTMAGPLTLLALLGGWVLERAGFVWLFALEALLGFVAFALAWRLPDSRNLRNSPQAQRENT